MTFDDIESTVSSLMATWSAQDARWLGRLFRSATAYETFTALENELFVSKEQAYGGPLLVSSATRGEGRTTIALLLAVMSSAFDRSRQVLLIDADTDSGRLSALFGAGGRGAGLRELFDGTATADQCIAATAIPNLWLTPLSREAAGGVRLAPSLFKQFVDEVRPRFDLMIVDSPAAGGNRGILSLANIVRNILIVVKYGGPTREQVAILKADLERAEASVLGCILNQRELVVPRLLYGAR